MSAAIGLSLALALALALADAGESAWATTTFSPNPPATVSSEAALALAKCGKPEQGLMDVAEQMAAARALGEPMPEAADISARMHRNGEPHVWPRAWAVVGQNLSLLSAIKELETWSTSLRSVRVDARCGVGISHARDGTIALVVVSLDAAADLSPMPVRTRTGQWVTIDARIRIPATAGQVVVLGPDGTPWSPPSSLDHGRLLSRFLPSRPGAYVVQVLADTTNGPRPVLEARLFADVPPTEELVSSRVPGEEAAKGASDDAEQILLMTNGLRVHERRVVLARDAALDAVARQHSAEMARTGTIGHDVGDGSPDSRAKRAGISAAVLGENVARGESPLSAHRSLYASVSHRGNLLQPDFARMGVGVVHDADGAVWVTELFASAK